jgi:hypothetical protein
MEDVYDYYELMNNIEYDMFSSILNKQKIKFKLIDPKLYLRALKELEKFNDIVRFPTKYIYEWKIDVLTNIAMLRSLTNIGGHSSYFPFDTFFDVFEIPEEEQEYDFGKAYDKLDEYNQDEYLPTFSNGQPVISDYGLEPMERLAFKLIKDKESKDILITINRILDVVHPRSDLAELFIVGGSSSLSYISNV